MALLTGQLAAVNIPATSTLTDVYTVPASRYSDVNITIASRSATSTDIRVAHIQAGTSTDVTDGSYLIYGLPTSALASTLAPISLTAIGMTAGDTIAVYSTASALSVTVNGVEDDV